MSKNIFNSVKFFKPKKNIFDLTHDVKQTMRFGELAPCLCLECVPGDKFTIGCETLIRFAPLVSPVMHRMDVTVHYFFVPYRLLWSNWATFISDPAGSHALPVVNIDSTLTKEQFRLANFLGIPPFPASGGVATSVSAFPFAAYQLIYNEYYRDQNLIPPLTSWQLYDGVNSAGASSDIYKMRIRAWEHDYFTAALPWAQKGNQVSIPLGDVVLKPGIGALSVGANFVWPSGGAVPPAGTNVTLSGVPHAGSLYPTNSQITASAGPGGKIVYDPAGTLGVGATNINDLRRAYRLQEWLERNARAGTRYIETILAHFGVKSKDERLQRPEYITGIKTPVIISEVLNTAGVNTGNTTPSPAQGNMAGHGIAVHGGKYGGYYCEEHGVIMGIVSIMPKTAYQQGIPRQFLKNDFTDFFWPSFAHLGEQAVYNQELYAYTSDAASTFGYVPRYAEHKYQPSRVATDFRDSLNYWHMGRLFNSEPALNQSFVECVPDKRIFAVTDPTVDSIYADILNKIRAIRPMPKYGTPIT